VSYVILEKAHEGGIPLEFVESVDTESVHVVVDLDDLLGVWCPELFDFFPKNERILFTKIRIASLQHVLRIYERAKSET
jgi:hypothetical protein